MLVTGIGRKRAFQAVDRCLKADPYGLVVSAGFAGATRPGFRVGDLVMASEVISASSNVRRRPAATRAGENGIGSDGPLVTVDSPSSTPRAKADLGVRYGALAVDMETEAVAEACEMNQVPWLAIRSILDPMETVLPAQSWRQGAAMLFRPDRWGQLLDLLRTVRAASRSLSDGLEQVVFEYLRGVGNKPSRRDSDEYGEGQRPR